MGDGRHHAAKLAAGMRGREWGAVSPRTGCVLVLYDHDGKSPVRRSFQTLAQGVKAFDRLVEFHEALKSKHRAPPNSEQLQLYARTSRPEVWFLARSSGTGVAAVTLGNWVALRTVAPLEAGARRALAIFVGCFLRTVLWVCVQRKAASAGTPPPWPTWVVRLLTLALEFFWPTLRATINDSVNVKVLPIANAAIAKMENRALDKLTRLELDIGSESPTLTSVALAPSLTGYDYLDLDVGVRLHGYRVRLDLEANLGGDELPDIDGTVSRFGVEGTLRLKLGPLHTALPCFGLLKWGFTQKPVLTMVSEFGLHENVAGGLPLGFSLTALDRFLSRLVADVLNTSLSGQQKSAKVANFKGSDLGRFPLVLADFWTSDHLSARSRSTNVASRTRAHGTAK